MFSLWGLQASKTSVRQWYFYEGFHAAAKQGQIMGANLLQINTRREASLEPSTTWSRAAGTRAWPCHS